MNETGKTHKQILKMKRFSNVRESKQQRHHTHKKKHRLAHATQSPFVVVFDIRQAFPSNTTHNSVNVRLTCAYKYWNSAQLFEKLISLIDFQQTPIGFKFSMGKLTSARIQLRQKDEHYF